MRAYEDGPNSNECRSMRNPTSTIIPVLLNDWMNHCPNTDFLIATRIGRDLPATSPVAIIYTDWPEGEDEYRTQR